MQRERDLHVFENFHSAMWVFDAENCRIHWANEEAIAFWRAQSREELYARNFRNAMSDAMHSIIMDDLEDYRQGASKNRWWSVTPQDIAKEIYCHFCAIELNDGRVEILIQVIVTKVALDSEVSINTTSTLASLWSTQKELNSYNSTFIDVYQNKHIAFDALFESPQQADEIWQQVISQGKADVELCLPTPEGKRWYQLRLRLSKKGHHERVTLRQFDTTVRKHRELHHQQMATTDQLTQIYNRFGVNQVMEEMISEHQAFTLYLIDLDKFKNVNDYYGHDQGDALLKAVAFRMQKMFPDAIATARLGGDEFLLLLPGLNSAQRKEKGSKLLECLHVPYFISGLGNVQSGGSIGAVSFPADADSVSELLLLADTAMYTAKTSQNSDCSYFSAEMAQPLLRRQKIRNSLSDALENRQIIHLFEPILGLAQCQIEGHEIKACWDHPDLGILEREDFFSIAEEMSLMQQIERQSIKSAYLHLCDVNQTIPLLLLVSINELVSGRTLKSLTQVFEQRPALMERLCIGVLESEAAGREEALAEAFAQLRREGVKVMLDDFGVGGVDLTHLSTLKVNTLRFDGRVTQQLCDAQGSVIEHLMPSFMAAGYQMICKQVNSEACIHALAHLRALYIQDTPLHLIGYKGHIAQRQAI
ncbi:MAG: EAL domain-containing protein [Pseudomonadales bacterium]